MVLWTVCNPFIESVYVDVSIFSGQRLMGVRMLNLREESYGLQQRWWRY
jgi:hypothetical protein